MAAPARLGKLVRTHDNPTGTISINVLDLTAHVTQYILKALRIDLLEHTLDGVDSTAAHRWNVRGSVSRDNTIAALLAWKALKTCASVTVSSTAYMPVPLNRLADDASRTLQASLAHY